MISYRDVPGNIPLLIGKNPPRCNQDPTLLAPETAPPPKCEIQKPRDVCVQFWQEYWCSCSNYNTFLNGTALGLSVVWRRQLLPLREGAGAARLP